MPRLFVDDRIVITRGSVTFAAGTTGAIAQHTVFTITGMVAFGFFARCPTAGDLTSGGAATISFGTPTTVEYFTLAEAVTAIDAGDFITPAGSVWGTSVNNFDTTNGLLTHVSSGTDIISNIAAFTVTGGVLEYYLFWTPISVGATVALGAELTQI